MLGLKIFVRTNYPEDKHSASIYGQDMELLMTESHMQSTSIFNPSPSLTGHNSKRVCLTSG